jgi:acetyl esterase/lipase
MAALPPAIMTTSRNDFLRNYTLRYHDALIRAGADSSLIYYALRNRELGHAFITMDPELPQSREAFDIICKWFEDHSK